MALHCVSLFPCTVSAAPFFHPYRVKLNDVRASCSGSWVRNANATELVAYPSMVGPGGTRDVSGPFFVTYTYVQPGEGFANRYMAWRNVTVRPPF